MSTSDDSGYVWVQALDARSRHTPRAIEKITAIPFPCRFICTTHGPTNHFFELDGERSCCECNKFGARMAMKENVYAQ